MVFEDRISAYPGRYKMTDENGNESHVVLVRDDDPTVMGTPLNADTFNRMQEEYQVESEEYPGCFYRVLNDVEYWVNPPMNSRKEYRTIERHNGKPVYVLLTRTSAFLEDTVSTGSRINDTTADIFEVNASLVNTETGERHRLPWYSVDESNNVTLNAIILQENNNEIRVIAIQRQKCLGFKGEFVLKYTKADDVG